MRRDEKEEAGEAGDGASKRQNMSKRKKEQGQKNFF